MQPGNRRAILAALLANLGIAIAKLVAWLATGAASMLAEGVHSLADTGNQALLLLGGVRARRAATAEHPFGYGAERYFWAFIVSMVLFLLGGIVAIHEGVDKLQHPHDIASPGWAVGVLLVSLVAEGLSFRTAIVESNKLRRETDWWSFIRHAKNPELPVVLLEDAGALLGLLLALVGVTLAMWTGDPIWDALGSVAIGALLTVISIVLATEMKSLLIGESGSPGDRAAVLGALESQPRITRVLHLRTLHLGPDDLLVAAKVELDPGLDSRGVALAINEAETAVRQAVERVGIIYLEPDRYDPSRPLPTR